MRAAICSPTARIPHSRSSTTRIEASSVTHLWSNRTTSPHDSTSHASKATPASASSCLHQ